MKKKNVWTLELNRLKFIRHFTAHRIQQTQRRGNKTWKQPANDTKLS
jgi:hypothetical protein